MVRYPGVKKRMASIYLHRVRTIPYVFCRLALIAVIFCPMAFFGITSQALAGPPAVSAQQAITVVQNLPEVKKLLAKSSSPKYKVILNDEEPNRYVLRLVMFMPALGGDPPRMTTVNWYAVDKATGLAYSITPGVD